MKTNNKLTLSVHASNRPNESGAIINPINTSTAYSYLDSDKQAYPRYFNIDNQEFVAQKIAALEQAETGILFASGMAAISTTILAILSRGDHVIFQKGLYGGTFNFIQKDLQRFGVEYTLLEDNETETIKKEVKKNTKLIYIETPSNPLLSITDINAVVKICKVNNLISVIDNTFASPINQNPITLGIDVVIHSATKYIGGHSDIQAGIVLSSKRLIDKIRSTALNFGGSINALMCHLLERSIKTLALRVERQNKNANKIAEYLSNHQAVNKVYYPGLKDHPKHEIASKQMTGYGGMVSFDILGISGETFQRRLKLIRPALSLGGVESTICSPATTSHRHLTAIQRQEEGVSDKLLRLSVGIEDVEDIIQDLQNAFDHI